MLNNMDSDIQCFHVQVRVRIDVKNMMDGGVFSVHDDGYSGLQKDGGNVGLHQGRKRSKVGDYTNGPVDKNLPGFTRFTGSNVGQRPADTPLEKMDNARQSNEFSMVSKDSHVLQKVETAVKLFKSLLEIIRNVLGGKSSLCSCADGKKKVETYMPHAMTRTFFLESQSTKGTCSFLEITVFTPHGLGMQKRIIADTWGPLFLTPCPRRGFTCSFWREALSKGRPSCFKRTRKEKMSFLPLQKAFTKMEMSKPIFMG